MNTTIFCYLNPGEEDFSKFTHALARIGFNFSPFDVNTLLSIELRSKPRVLIDLEDAGYFPQNKEELWSLWDVTEFGITLYVAHPASGDGAIFIPFENILSINLLDRKFVDDLRDYKPESDQNE